MLNFHDTFPELFATLFDRSPRHPLVRLIRGEERLSAAFADCHIFVTSEARDLLRSRGVSTSIAGGDEHPRRAGVRQAAPTSDAAGLGRVAGHLPRRPRRPLRGRGVGPRRGPAAGRGEPVVLDVYGPDAEAASKLAATARRLAPSGVKIAPRPTAVEEIPARLAAAHLGVVPTLRDPFTELLLPVKLLEYVHMGMPAVASRLPVIEHYFGDRVSYAEPGDPASIAAAIEAIRRDPESARERADRASRRLAKLEWRKQREEYLELVDELVGDRARGLR